METLFTQRPIEIRQSQDDESFGYVVTDNHEAGIYLAKIGDVYGDRNMKNLPLMQKLFEPRTNWQGYVSSYPLTQLYSRVRVRNAFVTTYGTKSNQTIKVPCNCGDSSCRRSDTRTPLHQIYPGPFSLDWCNAVRYGFRMTETKWYDWRTAHIDQVLYLGFRPVRPANKKVVPASALQG